MVDVGTVHHHAAQHREFGNGRTHQGQQRAQQAAIKGQGLQGPAIQGGTAQIREVVGVFGVGAELDLGLRFEPLDGGRPAVQKRLPKHRRTVVADGVVQITRGVRQRIGRVDAGAVMGAGNPGGAGRQRRRAAHIGGTFDKQHAGAVQRGKQRRAQARAPGADHHHVKGIAVLQAFGISAHPVSPRLALGPAAKRNQS